MHRTRVAALATVALLSGASQAQLYLWDDGGAEWGLVGGPQFWAANTFAVQTEYREILSIDVSTGTGFGIGNSIQAGVWSDPNQDGDPSDAVLLGSTPSASALLAPNVFQNLALTAPVDVGPSGTLFFVGVIAEAGVAIGVDTDYAGANVGWRTNTPSDLTTRLTLNGLLGPSDDSAFLIRAHAQVPSPGPAALVALSGLVAARRRRAS